ncbi:MAG: ChaN family lipoprotein [Bacteriovoracaceae bacterium]|nr:ChaN family lipoprotein [Bacteriovoracaceae bacterium]
MAKKPDKSEIISLQKSIYSYMRSKAHSYEGQMSKELKKYQRDQKKFISRPFKCSNLSELLKSIEHANIVYLGDFHTFDQNSKNLERLLRAITGKQSNFALGVELVSKLHQHIIDQYLNRHITEMEFLEDVNYQESWRFPWQNYSNFFKLARQDDFKILGLNSQGTLAQRDQTAAEIITDYLKAHPETTILVLFGEHHIVPDKLPKCVEKIMGPDVLQTIIHQNLDEIYWKMQESSCSNRQIIKFTSSEFSLQTSPPWTKYESMIYWYENMLDDPEFDIHEYSRETGNKTFCNNVNENFFYICKEIIRSLGIEIEQKKLEDFNLYDNTKLKFVLGKIEAIEHSPLSNFYKKLVQTGKTFKIPFKHSMYCSNYSINRLSFLAGNHIYSIIRKKVNPDFEKILTQNKQTDKFLFFLYQCLMSYFSSKIINPYRKCDLYQDLHRRYQSQFTKKKKKKNLKLALDIIDRNLPLADLLKGHDIRALHSAAKSIANFMADTLYDDFYQTQRPLFEKLINNVLYGEHDLDDINELLSILLPPNDYKNQKKRFF